MLKRITITILIVCFFCTNALGPAGVQASELFLPAPGTMLVATPGYVPVLMRGLQVHAGNPLLFDFIIDAGNSGLKVDGLDFKAESEKLIKYFLASLTIKEEDQWVNLSPYEQDRIIPDALGTTVLGRDMLAQDYILKQLTASMIYPEKELGKTFWDKVYAKAQGKFDIADVPMDVFHKVWITADKAKVLEHKNAGYVVGAHLKVMLESDYLAQEKALGRQGARSQDGTGIAPDSSQELAKQVLREVIIPELEREVNEGRNFANLRQIFYAMILASWYKLAIKGALLNQVYANQGKVEGIESGDPGIKHQIYAQYLEAYKKGVFNYIKEEADNTTGGVVPRRYFSGGLRIMTEAPQLAMALAPGESLLAVGSAAMVSAAVDPREGVGNGSRGMTVLVSERFPKDRLEAIKMQFPGVSFEIRPVAEVEKILEAGDGVDAVLDVDFLSHTRYGLRGKVITVAMLEEANFEEADILFDDLVAWGIVRRDPGDPTRGRIIFKEDSLTAWEEREALKRILSARLEEIEELDKFLNSRRMKLPVISSDIELSVTIAQLAKIQARVEKAMGPSGIADRDLRKVLSGIVGRVVPRKLAGDPAATREAWRGVLSAVERLSSALDRSRSGDDPDDDLLLADGTSEEMGVAEMIADAIRRQMSLGFSSEPGADGEMKRVSVFLVRGNTGGRKTRTQVKAGIREWLRQASSIAQAEGRILLSTVSSDQVMIVDEPLDVIDDERVVKFNNGWIAILNFKDRERPSLTMGKVGQVWGEGTLSDGLEAVLDEMERLKDSRRQKEAIAAFLSRFGVSVVESVVQQPADPFGALASGVDLYKVDETGKEINEFGWIFSSEEIKGSPGGVLVALVRKSGSASRGSATFQVFVTPMGKARSAEDLQGTIELAFDEGGLEGWEPIKLKDDAREQRQKLAWLVERPDRQTWSLLSRKLDGLLDVPFTTEAAMKQGEPLPQKIPARDVTVVRREETEGYYQALVLKNQWVLYYDLNKKTLQVMEQGVSRGEVRLEADSVAQTLREMKEENTLALLGRLGVLLEVPAADAVVMDRPSSEGFFAALVLSNQWTIYFDENKKVLRLQEHNRILREIDLGEKELPRVAGAVKAASVKDLLSRLGVEIEAAMKAAPAQRPIPGYLWEEFALFGDQVKKSLNEISASERVRGVGPEGVSPEYVYALRVRWFTTMLRDVSSRGRWVASDVREHLTAAFGDLAVLRQKGSAAIQPFVDVAIEYFKDIAEQLARFEQDPSASDGVSRHRMDVERMLLAGLDGEASQELKETVALTILRHSGQFDASVVAQAKEILRRLIAGNETPQQYQPFKPADFILAHPAEFPDLQEAALRVLIPAGAWFWSAAHKVAILNHRHHPRLKKAAADVLEGVIDYHHQRISDVPALSRLCLMFKDRLSSLRTGVLQEEAIHGISAAVGRWVYSPKTTSLAVSIDMTDVILENWKALRLDLGSMTERDWVRSLFRAGLRADRLERKPKTIALAKAKAAALVYDYPQFFPDIMGPSQEFAMRREDVFSPLEDIEDLFFSTPDGKSIDEFGWNIRQSDDPRRMTADFRVSFRLSEPGVRDGEVVANIFVSPQMQEVTQDDYQGNLKLSFRNGRLAGWKGLSVKDGARDSRVDRRTPLLWLFEEPGRERESLLARKFALLENQLLAASSEDYPKSAVDGGIDLNAKKMDLDVTAYGDGIHVQFDPAMIRKFQSGDFSGIAPVILQISPISGPGAVLGLREGTDPDGVKG